MITHRYRNIPNKFSIISKLTILYLLQSTIIHRIRKFHWMIDFTNKQL